MSYKRQLDTSLLDMKGINAVAGEAAVPETDKRGGLAPEVLRRQGTIVLTFIREVISSNEPVFTFCIS